MRADNRVEVSRIELSDDELSTVSAGESGLPVVDVFFYLHQTSHEVQKTAAANLRA